MIGDLVHVFNWSNTVHGDAASALVCAQLAEDAGVGAGGAEFLLFANPSTGALVNPLL